MHNKMGRAWDNSEKEFRTMVNNFIIITALTKADMLNKDEEITKRRENNVCKCCNYTKQDLFSVQAVTATNCGRCQKEMTFPTGKADRLCIECAKETNSCKECGGSMD